ncbi:biopolymer transporter ExbD [Serratia bockelmannii]|jgi:biopolymer transport protein ExbD|uniref:Biopolymer transport protein n=1 Tax=Serratia marcescens subsp. marcescens Db11 TaxID=273526 RepID=A0ABC9IRN8_SERMA|nr:MULTISPECIES: biopolymer transporter ExbD [Serratia]KFF80643.1 biopolymer transporter ExbD [Serratia marcescens]MBH2716243.1 biopolymer transporter ExbD [Serratia marcescens]MBH2749384.1 biopolymer transporter ExbD [Serratia marcescens]MBH2825504.1 biopolymer transporter ExbD [Serratia marcescens]MBH2935064.1 biopolymer transporter ExbD [Serratia marcescens]
MRNWNEPKKNKAHIELIPMIDVMMFLLVFFVLISLNVIPALGLKTQLPSAGSAQQLKPQKKAIITLGADEQLQLDGQPIALGALVTTLKQQQQANQTTTTIIVNSDKGVAVERLVAVMDNLRQGGFFSVSIATRKL